jgi:RNA 3'-terminal phosphate cyclase (ATP)
MIEIDGSHGEGGGQILRTCVSLSAVTGDPVRITKIREGRPNPGLKPQHVTGISAVAEICGAEVDGLYTGSKDIVFRPNQLTGGTFEFEVGTAGSISLVLATCLPPLVQAKARTRLTVRGGTDVRWSPPIDYLRLALVPILERFGCGCDIGIVSRGFYPEGGGDVSVEVSPTGAMKPVNIGARGEVLRVEGVSYAQNLPEHVSSRMKHSAIKKLLDSREIRIETDIRKGPSTGAGIVLVAVCENTVIGSSALGAKGVRSESLGESCAEDLLDALRSKATVDEHMADQILIYMALAEEGSMIIAEDLSSHAVTNMWAIEQMLGKRFSLDRKEGSIEIRAI